MAPGLESKSAAAGGAAPVVAATPAVRSASPATLRTRTLCVWMKVLGLEVACRKGSPAWVLHVDEVGVARIFAPQEPGLKNPRAALELPVASRGSGTAQAPKLVLQSQLAVPRELPPQNATKTAGPVPNSVNAAEAAPTVALNQLLRQADVLR